MAASARRRLTGSVRDGHQSRSMWIKKVMPIVHALALLISIHNALGDPPSQAMRRCNGFTSSANGVLPRNQVRALSRMSCLITIFLRRSAPGRASSTALTNRAVSRWRSMTVRSVERFAEDPRDLFGPSAARSCDSRAIRCSTPTTVGPGFATRYARAPRFPLWCLRVIPGQVRLTGDTSQTAQRLMDAQQLCEA